MTGWDDVHTVKRLLLIYLQSPSLRHLRHETSVNQLAATIVKELEPQPSLWKKWTVDRQAVVERAAGCWVPLPDLTQFLNSLAGPRLTKTDVSERLKHEEDQQYMQPREEFRTGCESVYRQDKHDGSEFFATVCRVRAHLEQEQVRHENQKEEDRKRCREEEYQSRIARLMSGADTAWTQQRGSQYWYCRINARAYRLSRTDDGRWKLERVQEIDDATLGNLVGAYSSRREAGKSVKTIAYRPDFK